MAGSQGAAMRGAGGFAPKRLRCGAVQRLYVCAPAAPPKSAAAGDVVTGYLLVEDYGAMEDGGGGEEDAATP